jgi:hypothetical protein
MSTNLALISFVAVVVHVGSAQADDVLRVRTTPFRVTVSGDGMLVKTWDRFTTTSNPEQVRSFDFATNRMCTVVSAFIDCVRKDELTPEGLQAWEAAQKLRAEIIR